MTALSATLANSADVRSGYGARRCKQSPSYDLPAAEPGVLEDTRVSVDVKRNSAQQQSGETIKLSARMIGGRRHAPLGCRHGTKSAHLARLQGQEHCAG